MEGVPQDAQIARLSRPPDLSARVVYFPIRHHSPACAWHARELIRAIRPEAVLIEGPASANVLLDILMSEETRPPVALFTSYVRKRGAGEPERFGAYYPLCEYSPEYVAMSAAKETGARIKWIDLDFAQMVEHGKYEEGRAASLHEEHHLKHSRFLEEACRRRGVRNPDDLWDVLFELDYRERKTDEFMRDVYAYCALGRASWSDEALEADGTLAREREMAAAIAEENGRVVVITGGFHSVALAATKAKRAKKVEADPGDTIIAPIRYSFDQLDRLNGYASGMPSPEFYQRAWEDRPPAELIVELGRDARGRGMEVTAPDEIGAVEQMSGLARLRGHVRPSREDFLDAVRSTFVKGDIDVEGVIILAGAQRLLAGDRIGSLPKDAAQPPIVQDFYATAENLKLDVARIAPQKIQLDLYRKPRDRRISRFLHQLAFLGVEFGKKTRGPDFAARLEMHRIQEEWAIHWSPRNESTLIERSMYGSTVEEAAANKLLEAFNKAERSAGFAARLLLKACRMGLHRHTVALAERLHGLAADDASFISVVDALETILLLRFSMEPLEASHLKSLPGLCELLYQRACYLIPSLGSIPGEQIEAALDALNAFQQAYLTMGDSPEREFMRRDRIQSLADDRSAEPTLRGAAVGLAHADGWLDDAELGRRVAGFMHAADAGAYFLRGLMRTARDVLWNVPAVLEAIHEVLGEMEDDVFVRELPMLRLALAELSPREADRVGRAVSALAGRQVVSGVIRDFSEQDLLDAVEIDKAVRESLAGDGLGGWAS